MAGLNIPGVTDQYKTNDTVEKLMQIERIPLTREQNQLDEYKAQSSAWREINSQLTSLRDSVKSLYSFENPFNQKLTSSSDEGAVTADANRSADIQSFKIDVIQPATADRFLTDDLPGDYKVPQGVYTYKAGEKQLTVNWKGGTLKDFSSAINKRSNGIVKSMLIGASGGKKTLLIEALTPGRENRLMFEGAAKDFALSSGMISTDKSDSLTFADSASELKEIPARQANDQQGMPALSKENVFEIEGSRNIQPRGAFQAELPQEIFARENQHITFSITSEQTEDITVELNNLLTNSKLPSAGSVEYDGITVYNEASETTIDISKIPPEPLNKISTPNAVYALMADGSEKLIPTDSLLSEQLTTVDIDLAEYEGIQGILIKNENTGIALNISDFTAYDYSKGAGYTPNHPVSQASDAIIKYEGITITRPTNDIDDVIPEITLHLHDKTEKTATISVKTDPEASKNALIEFVGKYNQAVAQINILSQTKPEIIEELSYLSADEKEAKQKQLGMFQTDFSLTNIKSNMQSIVSMGYRATEDASITTLAEIGISTNATGGNSSYSASRLRGYLEIDEKKLDAALSASVEDIKNIFGYDSDGDLIIDSGIAYRLDKQLTAYTQTGGILSMKTSSLDSKIKSSETRISRLEDQMESKEAELRQKYSQMEGSLNSLESQQTTISNFTRQNNSNR